MAKEKIVQEGGGPTPDVDLQETSESLKARLRDLVEEKKGRIDPDVSRTIFQLLNRMRVTKIHPTEGFTIELYPGDHSIPADATALRNLTDVITKLNKSDGVKIHLNYNTGPIPKETLNQLKNKVELVEAMR